MPFSHDRAFMESCCTQLLELDHGGFTAMHPFGGEGSYDAFKEVRLLANYSVCTGAGAPLVGRGCVHKN